MRTEKKKQKYLSVIAVAEDGTSTWYKSLGAACMDTNIPRETLIRLLITGEDDGGVQWQWACDCDEELRLCCMVAYFTRKLNKSELDRRKKYVTSKTVQEVQKADLESEGLL